MSIFFAFVCFDEFILHLNFKNCLSPQTRRQKFRSHTFVSQYITLLIRGSSEYLKKKKKVLIPSSLWTRLENVIVY